MSPLLRAKLDSSNKKANWIEQIINLVAELCILFAVVIIWYGSEDGVLSMEKLETGQQYAEDYTEICIDGGNHAGFGSYGAQSGDGTPVSLEIFART